MLRQAQHDRKKTVRPEPVEGRSAMGKQVALLVAAWIAATRKKDSSLLEGDGRSG